MCGGHTQRVYAASKALTFFFYYFSTFLLLFISTFLLLVTFAVFACTYYTRKLPATFYTALGGGVLHMHTRTHTHRHNLKKLRKFSHDFLCLSRTHVRPRVCVFVCSYLRSSSNRRKSAAPRWTDVVLLSTCVWGKFLLH